MQLKPKTFCFRSDLFQVSKDEDEETNPFCYGKSLAKWLHQEFSQIGYQPEPIIADDWGWCLMLQREPFMLWIACGNDRSAYYETVTPEQKSDFVPDAEEILWHCAVIDEVPFWKMFFWKKLVGIVSTDEAVDTVRTELYQILTNESRIHLISETSPETSECANAQK